MWSSTRNNIFDKYQDCNGWLVHPQAEVYRGVLHSLKMDAPGWMRLIQQSTLEAQWHKPKRSKVANVAVLSNMNSGTLLARACMCRPIEGSVGTVPNVDVARGCMTVSCMKNAFRPAQARQTRMSLNISPACTRSPLFRSTATPVLIPKMQFHERTSCDRTDPIQRFNISMIP